MLLHYGPNFLISVTKDLCKDDSSVYGAFLCYRDTEPPNIAGLDEYFAPWYEAEDFYMALLIALEKVFKQMLKDYHTEQRLAIVDIMQKGQEKAAKRSYLASDHNPFARQVAEYAGLREYRPDPGPRKRGGD